MMGVRPVVVAIAMAVPPAAAAFAQNQPTNPLIGAWERISVTWQMVASQLRLPPF
jgi:hypothetical protein